MANRFSYHKLNKEGCWFDEEEEERVTLSNKARKWSRGLTSFGIKKRPKLRIPGLRRLLRKRRTSLFSKLSWRNALERLKNWQSNMNDLFGGNFLVLQANHTPFKTGNKTCSRDRVHGCR